MTYTIAFAGKGGVGKTTLSALAAGILAEKGTVLAVDADPNANFGEKLGLAPNGSIGEMREEMLKEVEKLPMGMSKQEYIELRMKQLVTEGDKIDLLVMGRPEGKGCYCYVNSVLRNNIDILSDRYAFVVMDNEAGLEHLSRRTTRNVDVLFVVSDATMQGMKTAQRIMELSKGIDLSIKKRIFVVNMVEQGAEERASEMAMELGLESPVFVPYDEPLNVRVSAGLPVVNGCVAAQALMRSLK